MLPTEKMSTTPSPKKKSEFLGDLTAGEIKLIMASFLCMSGKVRTVSVPSFEPWLKLTVPTI